MRAAHLSLIAWLFTFGGCAATSEVLQQKEPFDGQSFRYVSVTRPGNDIIIGYEGGRSKLIVDDMVFQQDDCESDQFSVCFESMPFEFAIVFPQSWKMMVGETWSYKGEKFEVVKNSKRPWFRLYADLYLVKSTRQSGKSNIYLVGKGIGLVAIYLNADIGDCGFCVSAENSFVLESHFPGLSVEVTDTN